MIELIFVIVIIGILAAVAMPRLAANRDNATSSICAYEVGQLVQEIGNSYNKNGYSKFQNITIADISSIRTNVTPAGSGISEAATTTVNNTGVTYYCEGDAVAKITSTLTGADYILKIEDKNPTSPAALGAKKKLINQNILKANGTREYQL